MNKSTGMDMSIEEKLCKLREAMKTEDIQCYLIPTSDYHDSEYISSFFKVREYFSGFTGSAGTLVVTQTQAALFTDGRYFIQAARELTGTEIVLMKAGEPGVPTIKEFLENCLSEGENLGFDGKVVTARQAVSYEEIAQKKKGRIIWEKDLAKEVWQDRPAPVHHPVYLLPEKYSGENFAGKLAKLRGKMQEAGADLHILTSLDDIAWLFNIRGNDVEYCPVVFAFAVIGKEHALLFAGNTDAWSQEVKDYFKDNNVELLPYESFYGYVSTLRDKFVLLSLDIHSYRMFALHIPQFVLNLDFLVVFFVLL